MANIFPPLMPSAVTVAYPLHPHVARRSSGGGETRIRVSNVRVGARLALEFQNIETPELQQFYAHWLNTRGTARDFQITAETLATMAAAGRAQLLSTTWKYDGPPKCIDICGGEQRLIHTLEIELISQPRRVAQYISPTAPETSTTPAPIAIPGGRL